MLTELPVFGICGHSQSGKTTLIERLLSQVLSSGLSVAVAKGHAHGIDVDREGKDSDRLFRAGADVYLEGPDQGFARWRPSAARTMMLQLHDLAERYDLVLVEGRKRFEGAKVWLLGEGQTAVPEEAKDALAVLRRDVDRLEIVRRLLTDWLPRQWLRAPVYGCILIGGRSGRMGTPKHLLRDGNRTWLERTHEVVARASERVVVVGAGEAPAGMRDLLRLPDAPDAEGPMAGILSAMRWAPWVSWLVSACDLPNLSKEALYWLLSTRKPGVWATLPYLEGKPGVEPLLAHYDFRARSLLESFAAEGRFSPSSLAGCPKVISPTPPVETARAWENINTPQELGRNTSA